ncbi:MAG: HigA family addiction module antidote protein [bacterium]|nr:HigA family addiction module antidote protein [bacterium]
MKMHKPPHPGKFIEEVYLEEHGVTRADLARALNVSPSSVARLIASKAAVSPAMAIKLEKALGVSAGSWLSMQNAHDLWYAGRDKALLRGVSVLKLDDRAA